MATQINAVITCKIELFCSLNSRSIKAFINDNGQKAAMLWGDK